MTWDGQFGKDYTERNPQTAEETDALHLKYYGVTRTELQERFLGDLPRDMKILEVGCGTGTNLNLLDKMGFENLFGIDVQDCGGHGFGFAIGDARDIPFHDGAFDLVFTSGLLIHIPPADLRKVMDEIVRVTKRWVWLLEYYSPTMTNLEYRGEKSLMWKGPYHRLFAARFNGRNGPELRLRKVDYLRYRDSTNEDVMALLEKTE
jgi:pseudaminic acid biosynthesis-associated methylase